jgi:hypothetical protein
MRITQYDYQYKINDLAFIDTKECYKAAYGKHRNDLYTQAVNLAYDYFLESTYSNNDFDIEFVSDDKQVYFSRKVAEYLIEENDRIKKACATQIFRELIICLYEATQNKVNEDIELKRTEIINLEAKIRG